MRSAFLILAHKNPSQLQRLVDALSADDTAFFLNIDKKSRAFQSPDLHSLERNRQIVSIENKSVYWGDFSTILVTLHLMRLVLTQKTRYDYVHLISGQDFPIKSGQELSDYLSRENGKQFLEFFDLPSNQHWGYEDGGLDRFRYYWLMKLGRRQARRLVRAQQMLAVHRELPRVPRLYGGSQWWSLTYDCVKFISRYLSENSAFLSRFKWTYIPDEMFFQTLILNSPYASSVVNNNLRHIVWDEEIFGPRVFTMADRSALLVSDRFLARKLDSAVDEHILVDLEKLIGTGSRWGA